MITRQKGLMQGAFLLFTFWKTLDFKYVYIIIYIEIVKKGNILILTAVFLLIAVKV